MKLLIIRITLLLILISPVATRASGYFVAQSDTVILDTAAFVSPYDEDNQRCFKCHGQSKYSYMNESLDREVKAMMFSERIIKKSEFYKSNHKNFSCTDCHSAEYATFPHNGELRMEAKLNCIDCHGGDETFHFDAITEEYKQSTHFKLEEEGFSCYGCHDPHTYRISKRTKENLKETIVYDNAICLNCHSNYDHFQLLTEREEINVIRSHDWLPNQSSHWANVRCIECHTQINENLPVAHLIKPKTEAVKRCNECHSQNSMLMASLYKFESKERRKDGFFNGIILNQSYVIGANRNEYLNLLSLVIFGGVLVVIAIHIFFRVNKL
jgi:Zn finger protein HypA/HybF involved in hydrogenase expression